MKKKLYLILSVIITTSCTKSYTSLSEQQKVKISARSTSYTKPEELILGKWNLTATRDLWRNEYLNKITGDITYDTVTNNFTSSIPGSYLDFINSNRVIRHSVEEGIHDTTEYKFIDFAWLLPSEIPPSPSVGRISISIEPFSVRTLDTAELIIYSRDGELQRSGPVIDTFFTIESIQYFKK